MKLSIIIPTIGRKSLYPLLLKLKSLIRNMECEVLVIEDGSGKVNQKKVKALGAKYLSTPKTNCLGIGSAQRNLGMSEAQGTHLSFLDDDDSVFHNYFIAIQSEIDATSMFLFCVVNGLTILGLRDEIRECEVSTQMIVIPNIKTLPLWRSDVYQADYHFIKACSELFTVIWSRQIIAQHN